MRKKSLLAALALVTFAAAVVVGLSAGVASAGEVTGNCNHATNAQSADNCKAEYSNGNSWCRYSGQNDNPSSTDPANPGGNTQNYGQDVSKSHVGIIDPSEAKGGSPSPGTECNPTKDHNVVPDGSPPRK